MIRPPINCKNHCGWRFNIKQAWINLKYKYKKINEKISKLNILTLLRKKECNYCPLDMFKKLLGFSRKARSPGAITNVTSFSNETFICDIEGKCYRLLGLFTVFLSGIYDPHIIQFVTNRIDCPKVFIIQFPLFIKLYFILIYTRYL